MTEADVVVLRPVEVEDLPILYEHQADPVANEMAVVPARSRPEFMAHWARVLADDKNVTRAIVVDGTVVGTMLCWIDGGVRTVGYWLGRAHWGRGYASRGLALLVAELTDRPLIAHVADSNIGSRRVLEHCGFVRTGSAKVDGIVESTYRLD